VSGRHETATEQAVVAERQTALRALLRHPLLAAAGRHSAEAGLVRRHATWLREWLARNPAWTLQVDNEVARLRKTPADLSDGTRPARDPSSNTEFNRRRYVVFCLALAALERADRQTTLGKMAEAVVAFAAADPALAAAGIIFDLASHDQRRDLVHATRLLIELCVLVRIHGDEQQYLSAQGDVLYNVNRPALASILNVKRGPSTVDDTDLEARLAAIVAERDWLRERVERAESEREQLRILLSNAQQSHLRALHAAPQDAEVPPEPQPVPDPFPVPNPPTPNAAPSRWRRWWLVIAGA